MDFLTMDFEDGPQLATLLQPALTAAAGFTCDRILAGGHVGAGFTSLSQAQTRRRQADRHGTGLHSHVWYEMCIALTDHCRIETAKGLFGMPPASLAVFAPGMLHCEHRQAMFAPHGLLWICVGKAFTILMPSVNDSQGRWDVPARWTIAGRLAAQLSAAVPHTDTLDPQGLEQFRAALLGTLAELYRKVLTQKPAPQDDGEIPPQHRIMLQQLERFILQHLDRPIKLNQLASIAHLSPNHLNAVFRKWMGMPVHAWMIHKRMEKAMALMRQPGAMAKQVALAVGYDDPLYFSRAFHRYFGQWPSDVKSDADASRLKA